MTSGIRKKLSELPFLTKDEQVDITWCIFFKHSLLQEVRGKTILPPPPPKTFPGTHGCYTQRALTYVV